MNTSDFIYDLPEELIAQTPVEPRDSSRLLVCERNGVEIYHKHFFDVIDYLNCGDALVVNHTRVIPARLFGVREDTGGSMEFLLLRRIHLDKWEVLVKPGKRAKTGLVMSFGDGLLKAKILESTVDGGRIVEFYYDGVFEHVLDKLGEMPLPPYIHEKLADKERYQTVYAKYDGSAAAPTAGLHFTEELLEKIKAKGIKIIPILLHVGLGTFRPVKVETIEEHHMHSEYWEISREAAQEINDVRKNGGRIIAVGTTSVRTLETSAGLNHGIVTSGGGWTEIFIHPGYRFHAVDGLITNFHLPGSTLLMLISAFMGREHALHAYEVAVKEKYRFFSFGDAMLII